MDSAARRILIELETGPPITGTLSTAHGSGERPFTGWLSLLAALHEAAGHEEPGVGDVAPERQADADGTSTRRAPVVTRRGGA